jgi:endonuclease/exonuclease/phosphatase family metal-dependent hydrolase
VLESCATVHPPRVVDQRVLACRQVVPEPQQAVSWIAPAADRDRTRLAEWCAAVGPVLFDPRPVTEAHSARPLDCLAIVSWNTHVGGGDIDRLIAGLRTGALGGRGCDDVVLLLQEVYRSGGGVPERPPPYAAIPGRIAIGSHRAHRQDVAAVARRFGMALLYVPAMRNGIAAGDPEDRGNAILSTLPLSDAGVVELPFEGQRRVAAAATIAGRTSSGAGWQLRLVTVHLDTALAFTRGGPFRARARQAEGLISAVGERPAAAIIAGDFNSWLGASEPAVERLLRAFPLAPPVSLPTWTGLLGLRAPLDHVFARGELRVTVQRLPGRFGSDHFPLLAVVDF